MPRREERRPFSGVTDLFSELNRMRDLGTHGREHPHEDKERTHASAWVPPTDIVAQGDDLVQVVDGLREGDRVVSRGADLVETGDKVP